jgi:hypothetical protein
MSTAAAFQGQAPQRVHRGLGILAEMRALAVLDVAMDETKARNQQGHGDDAPARARVDEERSHVIG